MINQSIHNLKKKKGEILYYSKKKKRKKKDMSTNMHVCTVVFFFKWSIL